ncbi:MULTISPECIES: ParB/RepB/Spo0J family partition protein [Burkholderia cepacia complex]|uniref:Chromosome-partitioning protein Spo0J n=3 Tax=Burkholderiales TaxID=80840 RepID=A0ABU2E1F0_9BURK|nr:MULTISPECIES: ParB/Srx family N-terminal domain-containing protein [Burkholderia cepacia complex]MDN8069012.1 ParB/Srx family N-terminal domain-containing protein [Burkholderia vietnamiensis]MDR8728283.1 Chromosome-partitioning protein Spo0J [Burkholderia pseudomultivorans]MDR8735251.1 Chromosome-partitioning protein Spo0J [Burkholderia pseudomultivorans]MDR8741373.1 Chromosome-partitioning protein Spo0J [Burkholderia pseudomultivorans]MDR8753673.1 Chromosome-partitioning protein Spo0J [Bur
MQAQVETPVVDPAEPATPLETSFGNEQPVIAVPYSSLHPSPLNARTRPLSGIEGLAANIRAKGLLQNLVVHEMKGGRGKQRKYGVCAGQRREAALDLLYAQKHIAADYPVPVRIVSDGEALAISLIENSEREGLDPFDVLRAYRMLAEEGRSVDYIAALFSASPLTVKRRMKLANVSPRLLGLLREDAITLDQLAALALADDHETQEHIWFDANEWQRQPNYLRQAITRAEIDASRSRLVRFVGLAAYEAAGGYVRRDLFSDDENAGYIADAELLQKLAAQKLDAAAEEVRAEGWGWIETRVERDFLELNRYGRLRPVQRPYTGNEQQQMDALTAQQDELAEKLEALSEDDESAYEEADRLNEEIERVNAALVALESVALVWDETQMAGAGAFVIVGPQGELVIERGLVRREDASVLEAAGADVTGTPEAQAHDPVSAQAPKVRPIHSAKLCQRLTAHRTAAIHAELVAQPTVALAALLHYLVPKALPEHFGRASTPDFLALTGTNNQDSLLRAADDLGTSPAWSAVEAQRTRWIAELPAKRIDLLPWLVQQDPGTTLLDLLAFCTGTLLDGITGEERPHAINALAGALNLDMTRYWTPTRATYFDHVSKARIAEVVATAVSPKAAADLEKMKKADAAAAAELRLAKVAWVPEVFTDREIPAAPAWGVRDDEGDEDDGDNEGDADDDGAEGTAAQDGDDADTEPDTGTGVEHINDTLPDMAAVNAPTSPHSPWPFPTADGVSIGQSGSRVA